ncbi:MAG TPA: aldolase/citrate lyase family protein [bacterium]|nr:aldolase/citrate lyase family protein [bacterium]
MTPALPVNRMREAVRQGRPSFGTYVKTPSPAMIEMLGFGGLDFVRIDLNGGYFNTETVENMIRAAHAAGVTPVVRVERNDPLQIKAALDMGALGIIVPEVTGRADVEAAIRAAKQPPYGDRHLPSGWSTRYGLVNAKAYTAWASDNITLSVQVETRGSVAEVDAIVALPGLDMVQCGRGTLSYEFGVPGEQYHPKVMEIERTIVDKALAAGKLVGLQYYPYRDPKHIAAVNQWIKHGVQCLSLGIDTDIVFVYRQLLAQLNA